MKRLAAIAMLALVLYNAFGYYVLFAYEREQARVMTLQDLPESAFQVLKFNLAIYTSVQNTEFEYVNDELVVEGKTYNIVKKRVYNDSLQLFYLRNFRQDQLRENLNEIVSNQTIGNHSTQEMPVKQLLKSFIKDYIPTGTFLLSFEPNNLTTEGVVLTATFKRYKDSDYFSLNAPPPELA